MDRAGYVLGAVYCVACKRKTNGGHEEADDECGAKILCFIHSHVAVMQSAARRLRLNKHHQSRIDVHRQDPHKLFTKRLRGKR